MEPVSAALLLALAGSVGSSAGQQAWNALSELVRRPFHRVPEAEADAGEAATSSGEAQWTALGRVPEDEERARQLSDALAARAEADPAFGRAMEAWHRETRQVLAGSGDTHNTITGGQHGAVVQARDIHGGITFGSPTAPYRQPDERS